jgi:transcriptional regulator with XRE-family HTH domain
MDYVTRLEQGRARSPSTHVLNALARALRLSGTEREYLFLLAGYPPPSEGRIPGHVTPGIRRLLARLDTTPVGVYDAMWNLVAWNRLWVRLMGPPDERGKYGSNVPWQQFTGGHDRVTHTVEQRNRLETALVADLWAASARYPADTGLRALVSDLHEASPRFTRLWDKHLVGVHKSDRKTVHHPELGPLTLDCDVFLASDGDLRAVVCTASPGSGAAAGLQLLIGSDRADD